MKAAFFFAIALSAQPLPSIAANDNRAPAGVLRDGVLYLQLELRQGLWHPEAEDGDAIPAYAFAEVAKPAQVPAPTIRVPQDTIIELEIRNTLSVLTTINGLHQRPGKESITVEPGAVQRLRFNAGAPGTYLYWGRTPDGRRGNGRVADALLGGAFIVDPPGTDTTKDRIFVLERWNGPTRTAINGKSWPHTERLEFNVGETVRWKIVNASDLSHPMHLHGFYFTLEGAGDGESFRSFDPKPEEFTHSVDIMQTFDLTWTPSEPGRWLYHCHRIPHMRLPVPLDPADARIPPSHQAHDQMHDMNSPYSGMGGMVMGITVNGPASLKTAAHWEPAKRLEMRIANRKGGARFFEITIKDRSNNVEARGPGLVGPPLVLTQDEPTEISIVNATDEPTAVHWHGIEIESFYDGVPGWGGLGDKRAPSVGPGESFIVRLTPKRPGSFIYHTHWHDDAQLTGGILGAMIVMPRDVKYDPAIDKTFFISLSPGQPFGAGLLLVNGSPQPSALRLRTGVVYRFRFMNMTPTMDNMRVSLRGPTGLVDWRLIAKDAAPIANPKWQRADQHIAVGETFDFEYRATAPGEWRLEGLSPGDNRRAVQTLIFTEQ